jgi:hypothetical protein
MDLGKFLADLAWWCPDDRARRDAHAAVRDGYGARQPALWPRAELWSVLFGLKLAARRCAVQDPAWPVHVRERVQAALRALDVARGSS